MKMDIQTVGFNAQQELVDFARQKTESLYKYYDQIVSAEIYLKLTNDEKGESKVAEIKLHIPGNDMFAEAHNHKFETAVNSAIEKLKGQIRKLKTKMSTH